MTTDNKICYLIVLASILWVVGLGTILFNEVNLWN